MSLILLFYLMCFYKLSLCDKKDGLLLAEFMDTHNQFCRIRDPGCGYDARQLTPCCGFCDCGPNCDKYGSCCLQKYTSLSHAQQSVADSRYRCVTPQYFTTEEKTDFVGITIQSVWMIARCGSSTIDTYSRDLCEKPGKNGLIETLIPVKSAGEHYRNKFCAYCNGVPVSAELKAWKMEITCKDPLFQEIYDRNLLAILEENRCNIFYKLPDGERYPEQCIAHSYTISKCNVTGLWPVYNSTIDKGCSSFMDAFNITYRNYYCYLCNTDNPLPRDEWKCKESKGQGGTAEPPFVAILDLSVINRMEQTTDELECDDKTEYEDKKLVSLKSSYQIELMKCLLIMCDNHRHLENQECLQMNSPDNNNAFCYAVFIKLTPAVGANFTTQQIKERDHQLAIQFAFKDVLGDKTDTIDEFSLYIKTTYTAGQRFINYVIVRMSLKDNVAFPGKYILSDLIKKLHHAPLNVELPTGRLAFISEFVAYDVSLFIDIFKLFEKVPNKDGTGYDLVETIQMQEQLLFPRTSNCSQKNKVTFDMLHVCPFVEISREDLPTNITVVSRDLIINESFIYKIIPDFEYRYNSKSVFLCLSDYKIINEAMPQIASINRSLTSLSGPKEILSLVCVCLSISCLLITILIYVRFTELHSQPGINTITLCIFLLLAQTVFQFGAGQTDLPGWACSAIGAVSHFLWLSVMFAMNVCSYDMFRIFRTFQKISAEFIWRDALKRFLYITISALIFVLINFIVASSQNSDKKSAYGGMICYLSSIKMHLITFIIPSATTIIINFLFFFYVVIKIGQTRIRSAHLNYERNYFGIYARLSTLTGLTWIFGFLQLFVKNELLEYQFILLNAGQGIFIMIAFVLNERIFKLLQRDICVIKKPKTVSNN